MEWKRKGSEVTVAWSLLSAGGIGAYWGIWHLTKGYVPVSYLFGISRWWDVLLGPLFSFVFAFLLTNDRILERILVRPSMAANFFGVSLVCSPFLGLVFGLEVGFIAGVILLPLSVMTLYLDDIVRGKIKSFLLGN